METERPGLAALSGLDDPVRGQLYEFVSGSAGPVGRDEAAAAARIGRALAAYHLDKLVGLGLLTASYQRPSGRTGRGAGRPAKLYARSEREFTVTVPPREYELAARLLASAVEAGGTGQSRTALRTAAHHAGAELGKRHRPGSPRRSSVQHAARAALREYGFEPSADEAGVIWLRNCPFHQLASRHPDLICGMNLALIEGLTAGLGASELCPELNPGPGRCCVVISAARPA